MMLSEGQVSDYEPVLSEVEGGVASMIDALPKAKAMLGDRGYDADWFREALATRIAPCIPSKANRKVPIPHDRNLYRERHKIEIMFGRLKGWRRIHPSAGFQRCFASSEPFGCSARYDRCAHTFMSAICIAATVFVWLDQ